MSCEDCSRSFNTGILTGLLVIGLILILVTQTNPFFTVEIIPKETSMTKRVIAISGYWDNCWLTIGEDDNALYWKCNGFASKIGTWTCQKEAKK